MDTLLVEAARRAGAEIRERVLVRELLRDKDRVAGIRAVGANGEIYEERATLVVGADGVFSNVARLVAAEHGPSLPSLTCGYYAYWADVPTEGVEFYVRQERDVLIFPTHDDLTCIWAGRAHRQWSDYRANVEAGYLATLGSELSARVRAGRRATPYRGTSKLPNFYRRASGDGWALVGDAAYHRDPLTGMGIGDAFLGATLLADAIDSALDGDPLDALACYEREFREQTRAVFEYTLRAAALHDPAPQLPLYAEVAGSDVATRQFMNVISGILPYNRFRENVAAIIRRGGAPQTVDAAPAR